MTRNVNQQDQQMDLHLIRKLMSLSRFLVWLRTSCTYRQRWTLGTLKVPSVLLLLLC